MSKSDDSFLGAAAVLACPAAWPGLAFVTGWLGTCLIIAGSAELAGVAARAVGLMPPRE